MSRSTLVVVAVLAIAVAGFAFSSAAQRLRDDDEPAAESAAAGPQTRSLDWRETYGPPGEQLVFEVERLQVRRDGWRVWLGLTNNTSVAWEVGDPRATLDRSFGLMLFATGELAELEDRNAEQTLPPVRAATEYKPRLPEILEPGDAWEGVISAPGSLVAGSWVRVVFGALIAVGRTPEGVNEQVVWITDRTVRLTR